MRQNGSLSKEEMADLKGLQTELRLLHRHWRRLMERLVDAEKESAGAVVKSRLLCVLHDCLAPALRDLRSIEAAARELNDPGASRQRRRSEDAGRDAAQPAR